MSLVVRDCLFQKANSGPNQRVPPRLQAPGYICSLPTLKRLGDTLQPCGHVMLVLLWCRWMQ